MNQIELPGRPDAVSLVALYGTGDAYMVCAFAAAFQAQHNLPAIVVLKESQVAIAALFPNITHAPAPDQVLHAIEQSGDFHAAFENKIAAGRPYFAHPHFLRSGCRVDHLCLNPSTTHADMYRCLLHLAPDASMATGAAQYNVAPHAGFTLVIPTARSWPNSEPQFWNLLIERLRAAGRDVVVAKASWSLGELFAHCYNAGWVIGPQCGVMAILCHAQFPCRKTLVTPSIDGRGMPGLPIRQTFPYAYVSKFAGLEYQIEEFKVDGNSEQVVAQIMDGRNYCGTAHDPAPVVTVQMPVSPGDLLDRLSVASIRSARQPEVDRNEYRRLIELARPLFMAYDLSCLYESIRYVNNDGWTNNEQMVRLTFANDAAAALPYHMEAIRLNKERIELKQAINKACNSAFSEIKSYYD